VVCAGAACVVATVVTGVLATAVTGAVVAVALDPVTAFLRRRLTVRLWRGVAGSVVGTVTWVVSTLLDCRVVFPECFKTVAEPPPSRLESVTATSAPSSKAPVASVVPRTPRRWPTGKRKAVRSASLGARRRFRGVAGVRSAEPLGIVGEPADFTLP
jgi:hypothetical protein